MDTSKVFLKEINKALDSQNEDVTDSENETDHGRLLTNNIIWVMVV
jgi:hypothetical protein